MSSSSLPFWQPPYSEYAYLNQFAIDTYPNFPNYWWLNLGAVCPGPGTPGLTPGIRCDPNGFTAEINLSPASLPSGSIQLRGKFQSPPMFVGLLFLTVLNLDSTGLTGTLPSSVALAPALQKLVLSNNKLQGNLSKDLTSLNLTCLSLANNSFTGHIPAKWSHFPCLDFEGNNFTRIPGDCDASKNYPSCSPPPPEYLAPPPPPVVPASSGLSAGAVAGIVFGCLGFLALVTGALVLAKLYRDRLREDRERRAFKEQIESELSTGRFGELQRFSEEELSSACGAFGGDNYVGQGGFSTVYKGTLQDGTVVAVKKMKMGDSKEGRREEERRFLNELEIIGKVSHKNLVHCVGFCLDPEQCLCLVLRFYVNGSVASRTRGGEGSVLTWEERLRIAKGAADGVAYLHTGCTAQIIHRDIKADNVLLDEKNTAVVADFGLATEAEETGPKNTAVKGTLGSIAPEYFMSGECTVKTDVYAYGVFLLELVSGKNVFDLVQGSDAEDTGIHDWLGHQLGSNSDISLLVDSDLKASVEPEDTRVLFQVALLCLSPDPTTRPTMAQVASMVSQDAERMAGQFRRWQEEAANMTGEEILEHINPAAWDNLTTGVTLDPASLQMDAR